MRNGYLSFSAEKMIMATESNTVVVYGFQPDGKPARILANELKKTTKTPIIRYADGRSSGKCGFYNKTLEDHGASYIIDIRHIPNTESLDLSEMRVMDLSTFTKIKGARPAKNIIIQSVLDGRSFSELRYFEPDIKDYSYGGIMDPPGPKTSQMYLRLEEHKLDDKLMFLDVTGSEKYLIKTVAPKVRRLIRHLNKA
jgi:hypothetical protein